MRACSALMVALCAAARVGATPAVDGCAVEAWGNCHADDACCASTQHQCFRANDHYSQCLVECPPTGWACSPTPTPTTQAPVVPSGSPTSASPTTAAPTTTTASPTTGAPSSPSPTTSAPTGANGCSVPRWGACTADGACCAAPGYTCFRKNEHYSQCLEQCPSNGQWECTVTGPTREPTSGTPTTLAPVTSEPTTKAPTTATPEPTTQSPTTKLPTGSPTSASPTTGAPTGENGCATPMHASCQESSCCASASATCFVQNEHYAQCLETCPTTGWACAVKTPAPAPVAGCTVVNWGSCTPSATCCQTAGWACQGDAGSSYFQCRPAPVHNAAARERDSAKEQGAGRVPLAAAIAGAAAVLAACAAGAVVLARRQRRGGEETAATPFHPMQKDGPHDV